MLQDLLPPAGRKVAYVVYAILGVVLGAVFTGYDTAEVDVPLALEVVNKVYLYLGGAFGLVAASHIFPKKEGRHEAAPDDDVS